MDKISYIDDDINKEIKVDRKKAHRLALMIYAIETKTQSEVIYYDTDSYITLTDYINKEKR